MKPFLFLASTAFLFTSCTDHFVPQILQYPFSEVHTPKAPDYNQSCNWAALPNTVDNADQVPQCEGCKDIQSSAAVDVFFIHPTLYLDTDMVSNQWNASLDDGE